MMEAMLFRVDSIEHSAHFPPERLTWTMTVSESLLPLEPAAAMFDRPSAHSHISGSGPTLISETLRQQPGLATVAMFIFRGESS